MTIESDDDNVLPFRQPLVNDINRYGHTHDSPELPPVQPHDSLKPKEVKVDESYIFTQPNSWLTSIVSGVVVGYSTGWTTERMMFMSEYLSTYKTIGGAVVGVCTTVALASRLRRGPSNGSA